MIRRLLWVLAGFAGCAIAEPTGLGTVIVSSGQMQITFSTYADGAGKAVSTANTVTVGSGNRIYREFTDGKRLVFGYGLDVVRQVNQFRITLVPLDQDYLSKASQRLAFDPQHPPTFERARELPVLYSGDKANVEVLKNPVTGQTITDTVKVSIPEESPNQISSESGMGFSNLAVNIGGKFIGSQSGGGVWGDGIIMVHVPAHGFFYFSRQRVNGYPFLNIGVVDGKKLSFLLDNIAYEFLSDRNILGGYERGELWVYRDDHAPTAPWVQRVNRPSVYAASASAMESFFAKR